MATVVLPNASATNLEKIESFMNDSTYKEALESSANYNTRLCIERRMRLPFLDSQTGVVQNHSSLFMNKRQRMPGLIPGQIYTYPRQRWRKKRRQYLSMNARAFGRAVDHLMDEGDIHSISQVENPALQDTDSKDSQLLLKDEVSKDWYYDEQDMLEMDAYDEPDPDSDLDYEESYSKRNKKRRGTGRGRGGVDSPGTPGRKKGGGRGRKKTSLHNFDPTPGDPDKPFACELCGARYKTRPGLTYHYAHSHKEGASDENSREAPPPQMGMGVPSPMSTMGGVLGGGGPPPLVNGPPSLIGGGPPPPLVGGSGGPPPMVGGPPHPGILPNLIGPPMPPLMAGQMPSGGGLLAPPGNIGEVLPAGAAPGNVYQDSYVSFLNHPAGTPGRRGRQPANPPQLPPTQAPPTLPPNLPAPVPPSIDDPPMPVLVPEKTIETMPPILSAAQVQEGKPKAAPSPYCDFCLGDQAENKKTGGSEELVSCSDCGRSGKGKIDEKPKKGRKKKV